MIIKWWIPKKSIKPIVILDTLKISFAAFNILIYARTTRILFGKVFNLNFTKSNNRKKTKSSKKSILTKITNSLNPLSNSVFKTCNCFTKISFLCLLALLMKVKKKEKNNLKTFNKKIKKIWITLTKKNWSIIKALEKNWLWLWMRTKPLIRIWSTGRRTTTMISSLWWPSWSCNFINFGFFIFDSSIN